MKEPIKPKRGTYVSRSAFAKIQNENSALKRDLYLICFKGGAEAILRRSHWKKKFADEDAFVKALKEALLRDKERRSL